MKAGSIELQGFAPDISPLTPGIFADCDNVIPTTRGFAPLPSNVQFSQSIPNGDVANSGFLARYPDGTYRMFVGTYKRLYELKRNGDWLDVTRQKLTGSGPGDNYVENTYNSRLPWDFAQFGEVTLATNGVDPMQIIPQHMIKFQDVNPT